MTEETQEQPQENDGGENRPQTPIQPIKLEAPPQKPILWSSEPAPRSETPAVQPPTEEVKESREPEAPPPPPQDKSVEQEKSAEQDKPVQPAVEPAEDATAVESGERDRQDRRGERPRRNDRRGRGRPERNDQSDRNGRTDPPESQDRQGQDDQDETRDTPDRTARTERTERSDRPQRSQRSERPEKSERSERSDRPERSPRSDKSETSAGSDRPDRTGRLGRSNRSDRPQRFDRSERSQESRSSHGGKELSIVIPVYNEEGSLRELYENIRNGLGRMQRYEIIFVDDGSTDGSARVLSEFRDRDKARVKIIRFRRNYGKSAALSVGFAEASGEIVVTMDSDLQDDPAEIPSLINEIRKGYDLVSGWKKKRRDPITKTIPSRFFNFVTSMMTGVRLHDINCGLKAYRNEVVKEIKIYGELHRYIPVLAHTMGFKLTEIPVTHHRRKYGKTKFGVGRFWKGFLDLITIMFTTRYLRRPLHLFGFWGIAFFMAGFVIDAYLGYLKFTEGQPLSNRPLFLGGILLIIVGVQFVSIGLLGEMIIKTKSESSETYSIREMLK